MAELRTRDAEHLAEFARTAAPLVSRAVRVTAHDDDGAPAHADRLVEHWRREAAVLSAAAGLGGRVTRAAQGAVSAAAQGSLVLCLCELDGVADLRRRVEVLARACLGRELPEQWQPPARVDAGGELDEHTARSRLVELGREAWAVRRIVGGRQEGHGWQRRLADLPVVGAAGVLLGERQALREVATAAMHELGLAMPGAGESWG